MNLLYLDLSNNSFSGVLPMSFTWMRILVPTNGLNEQSPTEGLPLSSRRIQLAKFCSTIKVSSFPPSLLGQSCQALAILSTFMCWTWAGTTYQGQFLMSCQTWQASKRWSQWEHSIITNKAEFPLQVCRVVQQCLDCYQTLQSEDEHQDMYTSKQITHIMVWNALHFARP